MVAGRAEPFRLALQVLRDRLRGGEFVPGARIRAVALAEELRLSPTPVREALARLAGEGLVDDRRGDGYFAWSLPASEIADLYRLSLAHLEMALDPGRPTIGACELAAVRPLDPVAAVEQLFAAWVRAAGGRGLGASYHGVMVRLGPVRRKEPLLFGDLAEEADRLAALEAGAAQHARRDAELRAFHGRRIAVADQLARLLEPATALAEK